MLAERTGPLPRPGPKHRGPAPNRGEKVTDKLEERPEENAALSYSSHENYFGQSTSPKWNQMLQIAALSNLSPHRDTASMSKPREVKGSCRAGAEGRLAGPPIETWTKDDSQVLAGLGQSQVMSSASSFYPVQHFSITKNVPD